MENAQIKGGMGKRAVFRACTDKGVSNNGHSFKFTQPFTLEEILELRMQSYFVITLTLEAEKWSKRRKQTEDFR